MIQTTAERIRMEEDIIAQALRESRADVRNKFRMYRPKFRTNKEMNGWGGFYFTGSREIHINAECDPRKMLMIFAHEIAHALQDASGRYDPVAGWHDEWFCNTCWKLQEAWAGERSDNIDYDAQDAQIEPISVAKDFDNSRPKNGFHVMDVRSDIRLLAIPPDRDDRAPLAGC